MKYLTVLLVLFSFNLRAFCPVYREGITCKSQPCLGMTSGMDDHLFAAVTCQKIYLKKNNKWVFDHYSLFNQLIIKDSKGGTLTAGFESIIREIK